MSDNEFVGLKNKAINEAGMRENESGLTSVRSKARLETLALDHNGSCKTKYETLQKKQIDIYIYIYIYISASDCKSTSDNQHLSARVLYRRHGITLHMHNSDHILPGPYSRRHHQIWQARRPHLPQPSASPQTASPVGV